MDKDLAGYPSQLAPHLTLRRVLGEGGSSVVFEAFHSRLKVPVAVKLLNVQGAVAEQAKLRLMREAELYALLDNPRIPRVYDVDELADGTPYVVMEFVPGGSLETLVSRGPLSVRRAVTITHEVLTALVYVHGRGVLHRDIKPANVILNETDGKCHVRLVDFGIAKVALDEALEASLTQQGTLIGTPHYMAPERLLGRESDERVDIYSVGVMLYEMLAGEVPFNGPTLGEVIAAALRDDARPIAERAPISPELANVVNRAMARSPNDRYASAEEMLRALGDVETALSGDVSSPRIVPPSRPLSSFPPASLDLGEEDLEPFLKRRRGRRWPLPMVAALGVAAWAVWPTEVSAPHADREGDAAEVGTTATGAQPADTRNEEAFAAAPNRDSMRGESEDAPAEPASAETAPEELPPGAPEVPGQGMLMAAEPEPSIVDEEAAGAGPTDELSAPLLEEEGALPVAEDEAQDRPQPKTTTGARAPRSTPRPRVETESYEPVRSVPLQPFLDQMDTMLKEPIKPPESKQPELLPDNPY